MVRYSRHLFPFPLTLSIRQQYAHASARNQIFPLTVITRVAVTLPVPLADETVAGLLLSSFSFLFQRVRTI